MSFRKSERIVKELRAQILSGERATRSKLPTYDELMEQFDVTRPTVARALAALRAQGLVTVQGTRGVYVADEFPHHRRYLWITNSYPGHAEWTTFMATFLELIENNQTGLPGEVIPLMGVDGRENNPSYQQLCQAITDESAAGLFVMNSDITYQLPILEEANLPRAAIWAPLRHSGLVDLAFAELIERACASLLQGGQRLAVLSPHAPNLQAAQQCLAKMGAKSEHVASHLVTPIGCASVTKLLMDRQDRPDAVFITDDNLIEPFLEGLASCGLRAKRDVYVLGHCNWPHPIGAEAGVDHIGFDVREIFAAARECVDAQRAGEESPTRVVPPRFASELLDGLPAVD